MAGDGSDAGTVVIDQVWRRKLQRLIADTPVAATLPDATSTLPDVDLDDLEAVIDRQRKAWGETLHIRFRLPATYLLDFAIAIYIYTLNDPRVYAVINRAMFKGRQPDASPSETRELRKCMPFIKFLDAALAALPDEYIFRGRVRRGIQWVFPSPDSHDPEGFFTIGARLCWYEFTSTSAEQEVMTTQPHFCGDGAGPRTVITVQAYRAYDIQKFSFYQGERSEYEVLFRPLSMFKVVHAEKNIIDPRETASLERSGSPDVVTLEQIDATQPTPAQPAPAEPEPAAAAPVEVSDPMPAIARAPLPAPPPPPLLPPPPVTG